MTARLPGHAVGQRTDEQTAEGREQHQGREAEPSEDRRDGAASELGDSIEQQNEADRAPARQETDGRRQDDETRLLGEPRGAHPPPRPPRQRPPAPRRGGGAPVGESARTPVSHQPPRGRSASARNMATAMSTVGRQPPFRVRARTPVTLATAKLKPFRFRSTGMPGAGRG